MFEPLTPGTLQKIMAWQIFMHKVISNTIIDIEFKLACCCVVPVHTREYIETTFVCLEIFVFTIIQHGKVNDQYFGLIEETQEILKSEIPWYSPTPNNNYFTEAKPLFSNTLHFGQYEADFFYMDMIL